MIQFTGEPQEWTKTFSVGEINVPYYVTTIAAGKPKVFVVLSANTGGYHVELRVSGISTMLVDCEARSKNQGNWVAGGPSGQDATQSHQAAGFDYTVCFDKCKQTRDVDVSSLRLQRLLFASRCSLFHP